LITWVSFARYYNSLCSERNLSLDGSLVKEYFPVSFVVPAILEIYQTLVGIKFIEISDEAKDVWHPGELSPYLFIIYVFNVHADVQQFAVWEKEAQNVSDFVGH
jgi:hypothetical protein